MLDQINRVRDGLILLAKYSCEQLALHCNSHRVRDQLEETGELVLLTHRALDLQEVVTDLILQLL